VLLVLCAALLSGRALWVGAAAIRDTHRPELARRRQPAPAEYHFNRYVTLKQHLPYKRGILGFASEGVSPEDTMGRYRIARYAMAPLVITDSTDSATIVADFPDQQALIRYMDQHRFLLKVYDEQTGLAILLNPDRNVR